MKPEERCPECGLSDGHKILCKTGNERARIYQDKLKLRLKPKNGGRYYRSNLLQNQK